MLSQQKNSPPNLILMFKNIPKCGGWIPQAYTSDAFKDEAVRGRVGAACERAHTFLRAHAAHSPPTRVKVDSARRPSTKVEAADPKRSRLLTMISACFTEKPQSHAELLLSGFIHVQQNMFLHQKGLFSADAFCLQIKTSTDLILVISAEKKQKNSSFILSNLFSGPSSSK